MKNNTKKDNTASTFAPDVSRLISTPFTTDETQYSIIYPAPQMRALTMLL